MEDKPKDEVTEQKHDPNNQLDCNNGIAILHSNSEILDLSTVDDNVFANDAQNSKKVPDSIEVKKSDSEVKESQPERGQWGNRLEFFLAVVGFSIGVGNVFRFPYVCYKNGGGAFLIPYFIALACCGMPLMFLELAWGQFSNEGPITAWSVCPLFSGIGVCACTMTAIVILYYNVIMCYSVYYMFASLTFGEVPWSHCQETTPTIWTSDIHVGDQICVEPRNEGAKIWTNVSYVTPATSYLVDDVLGLSSGLWHFGHIQWRLALALAFIWVVTFLCVVKGIKTTGKVVYFTATFPYFILFILLVRGVTLDGAMLGIKKYLTPDFSRLGDLSVWADAFQQVFYSMGPGWGGLLTFASFNDFHHNIQKDAVLVTMVSAFTSFFGGFVVFSILGFLSFTYNKPIEQIASTGITVAFETYPAALAKMPFAQFWSFIFFFMIIILGLDSEFGMLEALICAVVDSYPAKLLKYKLHITAAVSFMFFLSGLIFVTQGGMFLVTIIDSYFAIFGLLVVCFTESIVFAYMYGYHKFSRDIQEMLGRPPSRYFQCMWCAITPCLIVFILFSLFMRSGGSAKISYQGRVFPDYTPMLGLAMGFCVVLIVPAVGVIKLALNNWNWRLLIQPTTEWGPKFRRMSSVQTPTTTSNPYKTQMTVDSCI